MYLIGLVVNEGVVTVAAVARRALPARAHVARGRRLRRHVPLVVVRSREGTSRRGGGGDAGQVPLGVDLPVDVSVGADGAEDDLLLRQHRVVVLAAVVVAALADLLLVPQRVS